VTVLAGVDYGVRRIAYSAPRIREFHELTLKGGDDIDDLDTLSAYLFDLVSITQASLVAVEAPIVGASRNFRTGIRLGMVAGALTASARQAGAQVALVPPSSWKATVVGHGNAGKPDVSAWLRRHFPEWWDSCNESQDLIDATCLALHAEGVLAGTRTVP
jgi:Holliday junction resolvasome RuvABC endonuclease subunit